MGRQFAKLRMQPMRARDYRPKEPVIWEAGGSEHYWKTWINAITGKSDWVQIATWSDYSESTEISSSTGTQ
jgi:hypothetical protein